MIMMLTIMIMMMMTIIVITIYLLVDVEASECPASEKKRRLFYICTKHIFSFYTI